MTGTQNALRQIALSEFFGANVGKTSATWKFASGGVRRAVCVIWPLDDVALFCLPSPVRVISSHNFGASGGELRSIC